MNWLGKQGSLFHTLSRWWLLISWWHKEPGPWFNINMSSYQYRKSHCGDKTILPPSYLHNGISYTGKTTSLYWIKAQVISSHGINLVLMEHSIPNAKGVNIFQGYFSLSLGNHDDVIKWKHFPCYWPFVRGIHRSLVNSPAQRPVTRSFDVFFDLHLNKRLSKQWWGWWFETPLHPLWRHCNDSLPQFESMTAMTWTFWQALSSQIQSNDW